MIAIGETRYPHFDVVVAGGGVAGIAAAVAAGNKWRVHFMPDATGRWSYKAHFEHGEDVAVADAFGTGSTTGFHGAGGSFAVAESDKTGRDFRAAHRGLLKNRGGHYLTFGGSGRAWIKGGPDIPENFLGYYGFDNTVSRNNRGPNHTGVPAVENRLHRYGPHSGDWSAGEPDWNRNDGAASTRNRAGRNIVGAVNYIASTGCNSVYFLPMNLGGDGQDTHPFVGTRGEDNTRYDQSKLQQWEQVFEHAQSKGVFLHFQLAETEAGNENYFDDGELGPERKLFYRELIARFGHHPGLQWNLGEENDFGDARRRAFAAYIKSIDPYDHPVTTHTRTNQFGKFYDDQLGNEDFDMTSFQTSHSDDQLGDDVENWRGKSADAGAPWVISVDEPQTIHNDSNDESIGYTSVRKRFIWPVYLSGGGGFEMYVQSDGGGHGLDQELEDLREMRVGLEGIGHALKFMERIPFAGMAPNDNLVRGEDGDFGGAQVLAKEGDVYAIYLPDASNHGNPNTAGEVEADADGPPELDLTDHAGVTFELRWYNPRTGEFVGEPVELEGGDWRSLGVSPDGFRDTSDWAAVVAREPGM
ncbi:MAG: hypothetical protein ACP5HU_12340 [Phycisphaerae bacterium]